MCHSLKSLVLGGEFSSVVFHCLKTGRRGVAEVGWLRPLSSESDPSMSYPGKRNSCEDTPANINKCDFLESMEWLPSSIV